MVDYETLIQFENENSRLDFKAKQYKKDSFEDIIKDIISLANADFEGPRYIVIGVKLETNGNRTLFGVNETVIDAATYQQLITANVEPTINFDYFPYQYEDKIFGIFLLSDCDDKPYLMKKDYGNLKRGDCWIRKGSHNAKMERRDLDKIYEKKHKTTTVSENDIEIIFSNQNMSEIYTNPKKGIVLPSERATKEILNILESRKKETELQENNQFPWVLGSALNNLAKYQHLGVFGSDSYENKTTRELKECLNNVKKDYFEADRYELIEFYSFELNFYIRNNGNQYIEDATFFIEIPKIEGLYVAEKPLQRPRYPLDPLYSELVSPSFLFHYPKVENTDRTTIVSQHIGDIKHHIPSLAFRESLKVAFIPSFENQVIEIKAKIYGKDLPVPIIRILKINVIEGDQPT